MPTERIPAGNSATPDELTSTVATNSLPSLNVTEPVGVLPALVTVASKTPIWLNELKVAKGARSVLVLAGLTS